MYWLLRTFAAWVSSLAPERAERLGRALAWVVFDLLRVRRSLVLRNLALALPELPPPARLAVGRASIASFVLTLVEVLRGWRHDVAGEVGFEGIQHIRSALAGRRGAYVLCFHMGNWEAMGAAVSRCIAPAHVLVKKVGTASIDRFATELRDRSGFLTVKRRQKGDGYAAIKEVLAKGEIVGFVMDQARPGEPRLPFFGHPARTNTSLAAIWQRVPAPIVPGMVRRTGFGRHVVEFLPALTLTTTDDPAADVLRLSTEFNAVVEACVRRFPEQYFWMHNRWK